MIVQITPFVPMGRREMAIRPFHGMTARMKRGMALLILFASILFHRSGGIRPTISQVTIPSTRPVLAGGASGVPDECVAMGDNFI